MSFNTPPLFDQLNEQQRKAVLALEGPVLVVAGPGTGKTKTLTVRLAHLLTAHQVPPSSLLAVTFTTRAAREMRERLQALVGERAHQIFLGTFHGFCLQLLRAEGERLGLPQDFRVADRSHQVMILQKVLRQLGQPDNRTAAQQILHDLSALRNQNVHFTALLKQEGLFEIHESYGHRLRKQSMVDFDELLIYSLQVLEGFPEVRRRLQQQYTYVSVDEYQDVNPVQHQILHFLTGERGNLWVVGDVDQAIYAFRGAESEHFLEFEKTYSSSRVIRLDKSYRFSPQIATAASQIMRNNHSRLAYTLNTDNPDGFPIEVVSFPDEQAEVAWVVNQLEECVGGTSHYQHYKGRVTDTVSQRERSFRDFTVLSRLRALTRPLQEALVQAGIPFRVVGETRLFDKKVIKDVLAYLRAIQNPHDDTSLTRILNCPPRGIGAQTQSTLETQAEQQGLSLYDTLGKSALLSISQIRSLKSFVHLLEQLKGMMAEKRLSQFLAYLVEVTGLRQWRVEQDPRHDNDLLLLRSITAKYDDLATPEAVQQFLEEVMLAVDADDYDPKTDAVSVMTIHAAKGLEFTEVMLCGIEEGSLPYENGDVEEERRLFYVGLTRAKERAHIFSCRSRFLFGERREREPSRFLSEFGGDLKHEVVVSDRSRRTKKPEEPEQLSLL